MIDSLIVQVSHKQGLTHTKRSFNQVANTIYIINPSAIYGTIQYSNKYYILLKPIWSSLIIHIRICISCSLFVLFCKCITFSPAWSRSKSWKSRQQKEQQLSKMISVIRYIINIYIKIKQTSSNGLSGAA